MLKLKRLEIAGFRGFRDRATIHIPAGFLVLTGSNGSGKSSVCDAVEYALTGAVGREIGQTEGGEHFDDYFWWRGKGSAKESFVALTLDDDSGGVPVTIRRDASGKCNLDDERLRALLCDAGAPPHQPLREFFRAALLRGESVHELSVEMKETERFDLIREAVGGSGLTEIEKVIQEAVQLAEASYRAAKMSYDVARERVAEAVQRASAEEARAARLVKDESVLKDSARILSLDAVDLPRLISAGRAAIAQKLSVASTLERVAQEANSVLVAIARNMAAETATARAAMRELVATKTVELEKVRSEWAANEARLVQMKETENETASMAQLLEAGATLGLAGDHCPLCGSTVGIESFQRHVMESQEALRRRNREIQNVAKVQSELRGRLALVEKDVDRQRLTLQDMEIASSNLEQRLDEVLASARDLMPASNVEKARLIESLVEKANSLRQEATVLQNGAAVAEATLALSRGRELEREVKDMKRELARTEKTVSVQALNLEHLKGSLSRIRRFDGEITEQRLAAIFPVLKEFYERLQPHPDWLSIDYQMRGQVRKFLSLRIGEDSNPRFLFSSGQKRALGLAFLFAVHMTAGWCKLGTILLDDPAQHVDDFRALQLVETLASLRSLGKQVIATIEDPALAEFLCRRLRSKANESGSIVRLEYEIGVGTRIAEERSIEPFQAAQRIAV